MEKHLSIKDRLTALFFRKKSEPIEHAEENTPSTPEGIKEELLEGISELDCDVIIPSEESAKRPGPGMIISRFPEERKYVRSHYYNELMKSGIVICHGKLLTPRHDEFSDFIQLYAGGNVQELITRGIYSLFQNSLVDTLARRVMSPNLGDYDNGSAIFSYIQNADALFAPIQESVDYSSEQKQAIQQYIDSIAMSDGSGKVGVFEHVYDSQSRTRGHEIPTRMLYLFPGGEVSQSLQQDIREFPWYMEALSEIVVTRAGKELEAEAPSEFKFLALNKESMAQTVMHQPSGSEKIQMVVSFYDKDEQAPYSGVLPHDRSPYSPFSPVRTRA